MAVQELVSRDSANGGVSSESKGADMRTIISRWQLPVLILAATSSYVWAEPADAPAVVSQLSTVQATVKAVYPDKRSLTIVGSDGQPQSIFVGPDVKLSKLHAGDKINVSYYQGLAAQIVRGGETVTDPAVSDFTYKSANGLPGGGAGDSATVSVKIIAVDPGTNTVAFQAADGSQHVVAARSPNMQSFVHKLKPGETVDLTYTESLAVDVTPARTAMAQEAGGTSR
jgi:hypothetical protein